MRVLQPYKVEIERKQSKAKKNNWDLPDKVLEFKLNICQIIRELTFYLTFLLHFIISVHSVLKKVNISKKCNEFSYEFNLVLQSLKEKYNHKKFDFLT